MKRFFIIFFIFSFLFFHYKVSIYAQSLIGNCGGISSQTLAPGVTPNWAYFSGASFYWSTLEPQRGQFVFDTPPINSKTNEAYYDRKYNKYISMKQYVNNVPSNKKVLLQVVTDTGSCPRWEPIDPTTGERWAVPTTIPKWALEAGVPSLYNPEAYDNCGNNPSQWDPNYRKYFKEMLEALAKEYDNNPKVEGYLMMSGGLWGEGALPYHAYGDCATAITNPDNVWVKEMARIYNKTTAEMLQPCNGFPRCFDYYYVESIKKLIDLYANTFSKPVVLQLGSGTSCNGQVSIATANYAAERYGKHVWLKQNGWGNDNFNHYLNIFNSHRNQTRSIAEVGHALNWCSKKTADAQADAKFDYCFWNDFAGAQGHNNTWTSGAVNNGVSAVCFYDDPLKYPAHYPINWISLHTGLSNNYNNFKNIGFDKGDFTVWKVELTGPSTNLFSNYNHDQKISLADFEVWRQSTAQ